MKEQIEQVIEESVEKIIDMRKQYQLLFHKTIIETLQVQDVIVQQEKNKSHEKILFAIDNYYKF